MGGRPAALCPHCRQETYLLTAKGDPTQLLFLGKGVRFSPVDGTVHWNCACGAEHILSYAVTLAKSGPPTLRPSVRTLPPVIPVFSVR